MSEERIKELEDKLAEKGREFTELKSKYSALKSERESFAEKVSALEKQLTDTTAANAERDAKFARYEYRERVEKLIEKRRGKEDFANVNTDALKEALLEFDPSDDDGIKARMEKFAPKFVAAAPAKPANTPAQAGVRDDGAHAPKRGVVDSIIVGLGKAAAV